MSILGLASLYPHEFVEFEDSPLTACIPLATLVEYWCAGMEYTFLILSVTGV